MTSMELKHKAKLKEWSEKIQECRSSELSVTQWCRLQGCTTTTYYRWERELLSLAEAGPKRLEAPVMEFEALPAALQPQPRKMERFVTVRVKGSVIEFHEAIGPETVKAVIEALGKC